MGREWTVAAVLAAIVGLVGCAEFDYGGARGGLRARGAPESAPTVYVVRRGDTLYSIAWRYGLDYRTVARWNGIRPPYVIHPRQRLRLRPTPRSASTERPERPASRSGASARRSTEERTAAESPPPARSRSGAAESDGDGSPIPWRWPVDGTVTRRFEADGVGKKGITVRGEEGAPVRAAAAGRVVYSGDGLRGYGNLVIVKHDSRFLTAYGYNRQVLVSEGETVDGGQTIARMGLGPSQEPAVHFEIRRDGDPVDPLGYLPRQ